MVCHTRRPIRPRRNNGGVDEVLSCARRPSTQHRWKTRQCHFIIHFILTPKGCHNQIKEVERTKPELFNHLLDSVPVGKPSQYIKDMRRTADSLKLTDCDDLLKHRLISSQPAEVAPVLMSQAANLTASQLGEFADQMLTLRPRTVCAAAPSPPSPRRSESAFPPLRRHVGLSPFRPSQRQVICRAHIFYGSRARSCRPWCQWPGHKPAVQSSTPQRSRAPSPDRDLNE